MTRLNTWNHLAAVHKGGKCGLRVAQNGKTTQCIYKNYEDLPIWGYSGVNLVLKEGTPLV